MDLKGHSIIFGISALAAATASTWLMVSPSLYPEDKIAFAMLPKRKVVDGYVEMGLLPSEKDSIEKDCKASGNGEECKKIMDWSYANGQCMIYVASKDSKDYRHWYFLNSQRGLLKELETDNEEYKKLCKEKKSINFHYDEDAGEWKYDGYDRHPWS